MKRLFASECVPPQNFTAQQTHAVFGGKSDIDSDSLGRMFQSSTDAWERFNGLSGSSKGAFVKWLAVCHAALSTSRLGCLAWLSSIMCYSHAFMARHMS